jgi:hypothetical protein
MLDGTKFMLGFVNVYIQVLDNLNRKDAPELVFNVIITCSVILVFILVDA